MYLFIAPSIADSTLPSVLKTPSIDVVHAVFDSLGIDDSRRIIEQSLLRPVESPVRSFVVFASSLTVPAQNALLKLLEDPPTTASFHIVVPHESVLIGTLRSRLLKMEDVAGEASIDEARAFLALPVSERLAHIAALHKKADTAGLTSLARQLARVAAMDDRLSHEVRHEIAFAETRIGIIGGSKNMLLEHLALTL